MRLNFGIIDYGLGNVNSVANALTRLGYRSILSSRKEELLALDALILPGVGAFPAAMEAMEQRGLTGLLRELALERGMPVLGICLGMEVLAEWGEEHGLHRGLGLIPGRVKILPEGTGRKVPHVGWCPVSPKAEGEELFARNGDGDAFYFDHSYYFDAPAEFRVCSVDWDQEITAAVRKGLVMGVQFHPEKSQNAGLRLLRAFGNLVQRA
ncbi:MAG: imidazole glycerol phosphate synthase subunit HisH, partial [Planctomycetes bacterium]|nr:imidazole glycerol phosphate synthase subunit HisH [Planctomycetota bacterium]